MPRINAGSVAEHVAKQEAAVIAAAAKLFAERGIAQVSLAEIAAEVGLARNSLYRYFPSKGHLLAVWFRSALAPLYDASAEIAAADAPARRRLDDWVTLHLDYLTSPEHQAMATAAAEIPTLAPETADIIISGHRELYRTLETIVSDAFAAGRATGKRNATVTTMLITGLLRSAADLVNGGVDRRTVLAELTRATHAVTDGVTYSGTKSTSRSAPVPRH